MDRGYHVLFGAPGTGKSTAAAQSFQRSFYLASDLGLLKFYKQWLKSEEGKASGLSLPTREYVLGLFSRRRLDGEKVLENYLSGGPEGLVRIPQRQALEEVFQSLVKLSFQAYSKNEPPPFNFVVIDEVSAFWQRVFEEIAPTVRTASGKIDTRGAYGEIGKWSTYWLGMLKQLTLVGVGLVLITHDQDPNPSEDKKGGPKMPSQGLMKEICATADSVILRAVEDPKESAAALLGDEPAADAAPAQKTPRRLWRVHASQNWMCKVRGIPDSMFSEIEDWPLRKILDFAGYDA